ncbi:hypothetical protein Hypma_011075 [Hypsizygus marmoreus]|uniref:Transmembrane protein n=1 Tax=Hypsizygus marmoreus TaxID=39966 RepID=A0A369JSU3_HYPMA|nr:hypothetical protein Hypma_011075 [Hypsizygus marmoreus]
MSLRLVQNSNLRLGVAVGVLWGLSVVPGANAEKVCFKSADGVTTCTQRLSTGARIAICLGVSILLSIMLYMILTLCMRSRRAREEVYQVDAAPIQGPPTTIVTSFDARSPVMFATPTPGPKSFDPRSPAAYPHTPEGSAPGTAKSSQFPATQQRYAGKYGIKPPQTAPVNQAQTGGGYPFPGYSPKPSSSQQPYTSFQSGFPRPLYTGHPVQKDSDAREVHRNVV